ncbi:MAG: CPBP family intramembrane metalloprotease [Clostridia bacterium]|nr:CPBP family intramembrane metalloprotease [Clostridia bacterium]
MCEPVPAQEQQARTRDLHRLALQLGGVLCLLLASELAVSGIVSAVADFLAVLGLDVSPWLGRSTTPGVLVHILIYISLFAAPCAVFFKLMGHSPRRVVSNTPCGLRPYIWVTCISIFASEIFGFLSIFITILLEKHGLTVPGLSSQPPASLVGAVLYFLSSAVLPAVLEELFFRGIVLRSLAPYGKALALTVSSLAFGLIHCTVQQIPYAVAAGFCIGFFVLKYDNFRLGVTAHFINNATSVIFQYLRFLLSPALFSRVFLFREKFFIVAGTLCVAWFLWREKRPFAFLAERTLPRKDLVKAAFSPLLLLFYALCLLLTLFTLFRPVILALLEELL